MSDQSVNLYRRMRHLEQSQAAHEALLDASDQYEKTDPSTRRGALLKAREAVVSLVCTEDDSAANMLRHFFRTRKTIDGGWLRDLRYHAEAIASYMAPDNDYAAECLQSIVRGMSRPRLA